MSEALVVTVRGIIAFFTLLVFTRVLGKQQISQLTLFEYILGITIGSTASTLTTDLDSTAWSHWVGLFVWSFLVFCMQLVTFKSQKAMIYVNGVPQVIISNGKIVYETMKKIRYNLNDLLEQLRSKDVFDISQVEYEILETNGQLSVLKKSQYKNISPNDMQLPTEYEGICYELIMNGKVIENNLKQVNQNTKWLEGVLKERNISDVKDVLLATINTKGEIYISLYDNLSDTR